MAQFIHRDRDEPVRCTTGPNAGMWRHDGALYLTEEEHARLNLDGTLFIEQPATDDWRSPVPDAQGRPSEITELYP